IRPVLNDDERRIMPHTTYPFASSNSARYEPSWPVIPVTSARLPFLGGLEAMIKSNSRSGRIVPGRQPAMVTHLGDSEILAFCQSGHAERSWPRTRTECQKKTAPSWGSFL